jgi:hypothetical protein
MQRIRRVLGSRRFKGILRVVAFAALLELVVGALLLHSARARAGAAVQERGLELLNGLAPALLGPPTVASINGQRMMLASKFTPLPVNEVLDRFEHHCRQNSGGLAEEVSHLPEARALERLPAELRDPSGWLTSRQVTADGLKGQIMCLVRPDAMGGLRGLLDRIGKFLDSGDLESLGNARYVVARHEAQSGETHVLAMWTDGSFNIPNMFGQDGDAPGNDSATVPRPRDSRRVLSAEISGTHYALRMYDTRRSHADVLDEYSRELPRRGWSEQVFPRLEGAEDVNEHFRAFAIGANAVIVVVEDTPDDHTGVSLIEMGGRGFAQAAPMGDQP